MIAKTQDYVVQNPGMIFPDKELPVGAVVKLTEKQAAAFIGKVRLKSEMVADNSSAQKLAELEKANADLQKSNKALSDQVAELEKANAELQKAGKK